MSLFVFVLIYVSALPFPLFYQNLQNGFNQKIFFIFSFRYSSSKPLLKREKYPLFYLHKVSARRKKDFNNGKERSF